MNKPKRVALVTGASSGIGNATARKLLSVGYSVYGTSRNGALSTNSSFPIVPLDVTSAESVTNAVEEIMRREGRIDLLVNNAGMGVTGAAEESSIEQVRALFEVNFHGLVRVTNAVLPIMRAQKNGRILNIGSGLGFIPAPFSAYYSATKHAIEGYSESLDHEVRGFGVRVAVIEPGATNTAFESSTVQADQKLTAYDDLRASYLQAYARAMAMADTAESVAETIVMAALIGKPKLRYPSGKSATQGAFARRFLPRSLFDKVLHKQFGMN